MYEGYKNRDFRPVCLVDDRLAMLMTNRKSCAICRMVPFPMISNDP